MSAPIKGTDPNGTDPLDGLAGQVLRPGVAVTVLRDGIHLRGRRSSVTLEGRRALPALWRMLEGPLRTGDLTELSGEAPSGSPVRAALGALLGHLRAHDLLVEPAATGDESVPARWVRAVAERPDAAAAALASARIQVLSADAVPGPLAQAVGRALTRSGAVLAHTCAAEVVPGEVVLIGSSPVVRSRVAVVTRMSGGTAFVTATGSPAQARADAVTLSARLGLGLGPAVDGSGGPDALSALTALVAGAAVQRMLCAVTGMPDPASEGDDQRTLPDRPAVLVATAFPFQATYHCWLGPDLVDADRTAAVDPPGTLAEALRRVAALGDEAVGVLAPPLPGALPQLPVALAACEVRGGTLLAAGARVDLARLDALCRAAELSLSRTDVTVSVGVDPEHARGRALRQAATRTPPLCGAALPAEAWLRHPQARHWWNTLTGRLGLPAELTVSPAAMGGSVFHGAVRDEAGRLLGEAVEATPGDAAAFAALAATASAHAGSVEADMTVRHHSLPNGASARIASAGVAFAGWEDDGWTTKWLAGVASRERELQRSLRRLTGLCAVPLSPQDAYGDARAVAAALHGCGFTVLSTVRTGGVR